MDNKKLKNYPIIRRFGGIFWPENRVIFDRKQGDFGKGVNSYFSVAALQRINGAKQRVSKKKWIFLIFILLAKVMGYKHVKLYEPITALHILQV